MITFTRQSLWEIEKFEKTYASADAGWVSVSRPDDPGYHSWVNPTTRQVLSFQSGDVTLTIANDMEEFRDLLILFCRPSGALHKPVVLDCRSLPIASPTVQALMALGMGSYLH